MPHFLSDPVAVRAPATSANLGPGFDSLAVALELTDEVRAEVIEHGLEVDVADEGDTDIARDESNLVVRAARAAFDALGGQPPGLRLRCRNRIPHGRGLGSSAAAIVAGVLAARALTAVPERELDDAAVLDLAARVEGHTDNVAACLLGGFVIAWHESEVARAVSCPISAELDAVLYIPVRRSLTHESRALLSELVSHDDAVANAGRAALLTHALCHDLDLLLPATRDWLHQDARAVAMPDSADLIRRLRHAGVAAMLSGGGPSVLVLLPSTAPTPEAGPVFVTRRLGVGTRGAIVTPMGVLPGTR